MVIAPGQFVAYFVRYHFEINYYLVRIIIIYFNRLS